MDLLNNIKWTFTDTEYDSKDDFNVAISEFQVASAPEETVWNPEEILLESPAVDIVFRAWIGENDLLENEILLEDPDFFDDETKSEFGLFEADIQARIKADNGKNFSVVELMFKINEQIQPKELGDDLHFEGLGGLESDSEIPKFYLFCGS
ncbi:hypothetical protein IV494_06780 [Kaistella sp. G5-32]|uniref:Immunity protein 22 of polymorphic toxin system n=1 Tax=Kaistella gelatinilytica TaxID=2787636 RepID=A0ABS0FB53_9FLAO|nr:hypothetical protein [Kaistella gelatinilytica]MBF8456885.1 hypothetical protein [Kaistella gelatinilytica]